MSPRASFSPITLGEKIRSLEIDGFTVTEDAHPPVSRLARHEHERASLQVVLAGSFTEVVGGRPLECRPGSVVVNNSNLVYTIIGTGKISGSSSLTKRGTNSLTIATVNDYTGPTVIAAGTVSVTNLANGGQPSAIGASSAASANLVLSGGTLSYSGPAKTINRGYAVQGAGTGIEAQVAAPPVEQATDAISEWAASGQVIYVDATVPTSNTTATAEQETQVASESPSEGPLAQPPAASIEPTPQSAPRPEDCPARPTRSRADGTRRRGRSS